MVQRNPAGQRWVSAKRDFLFPVKALSQVFRSKFVTALQAAVERGELRGTAMAPTEWATLKVRLHAHDWVVYAKQPLGGPAQVLEYLGWNTQRVAISNGRIVGIDAQAVRFRVRNREGKGKRTLALPAETFIDRFLPHVLPKEFKRIRHYGLPGPAGKAEKLTQARQALSVPAPDPVMVASVADFLKRIDRHAWAGCACCETGLYVPTAAIVPVTRGSPPLRGPP